VFLFDLLIGRWGVGIFASTDLRGRRERLGATIPMIAVGLGLRPDLITDIENGTASDKNRARYVKWLLILESWPADKLRIELFLAIKGHRFRL
jgi:hypothetical protein